jgi:phosphopantothenoylcysteine decarboxylase / phosphopantothenate---cysteine ligase
MLTLWRMRLLITAGPTREPIDAVRFISNRSSGRMGLALAAAGATAGHSVTLLLGPGPRCDEVDPRFTCHRFETTDDLLNLLEAHWPEHDVLLMAAAVADYRPATVEPGKLPRQAGGERVLRLEATEDLVAKMAATRGAGQRVIAFALEESELLEARAAEKLRRKGVDAIVANPLSTMDAHEINAVLLWSDGRRAAPGAMSKTEFAGWLIERATE